MTDIVRIGEQDDLSKSVSLAAQVMRGGGVILYPTDTTYAIGVDALNADAVDRVFQIKGRDYSKPIHVVVNNLKQAAGYAQVNELAETIAAQFLPGALTIVLPKRADTKIPPLLVAGRSTLGVRIPDQLVCRALAEAAGFPITTTSANRSGMPNGYDVDTIQTQLGDEFEKFDMVLDAGAVGGGVSTVIQIEDDRIQLIREGVIPFSAISILVEQIRGR